MLVGIHDQPGSPSDIWIAHCEKQGVPYKRVDCFADDIVEQLHDCDGLIWYWAGRARFAYSLTCALEMSGKLVFPPSAASWHIDDKIAQKYLFESAKLPLPRTHVFYDRETALAWAATAHYPKIFKLRSGYSSENVWLVRSPAQAARFIRRAFGRGFAPKQRLRRLMECLLRLRHQRTLGALWLTTKAAVRVVLPTARGRPASEERGYAYFQDAILGTSHSFFVLVNEGRAYALRCGVRPTDFRAAGSGLIETGYPGIVPVECIEHAFEAAEALGTSFLGLEMLVAERGVFIIESDPFLFMRDEFPGFWDSALQWHGRPIVPARAVIRKFLRDLAAHGSTRLGGVKDQPHSTVGV